MGTDRTERLVRIFCSSLTLNDILPQNLCYAFRMFYALFCLDATIRD